MRSLGLLACAIVVSWSPSVLPAAETVRVTGRILDADSGERLPGRVYIRSAGGEWHFVQSADKNGSAIEYRKARSETSVEMHTTVSTHDFVAQLPPGRYTITVERGKEYLTSTRTIEVKEEPVEVAVELRRWIDMNDMGWYSGETHVHRSVDELPNLLLAEDLNVALPLTYWVTQSDTPPSRGDKNSQASRAELIEVDPTHVIYPMNTEYEIFSVGGKRHTLGAVFALNHKTVLDKGVPPVGPVAEQVRREGGLLELDKHNWPWSMMLVPVMNVDLYELTNNHIWRTEFFFRGFGEAPPGYMNVEQDEHGMTEKGWIDFTFENYYALLSCGFRMRPTAGTASGVHPVPLGFGRVYVHLEDGFSYDDWMNGLNAGRSFVTTGPMLDVKVNGHWPGHTLKSEAAESTYRVTGWARSSSPLSKIEIVSAGVVVHSLTPANERTSSGGFESPIDVTIPINGSTWLAVRCWEPSDDRRVRFVHSAPVHIDNDDAPLRPRKEQVEYLVDRIEGELVRNADVLSEPVMDEYRKALAVYKQIEKTAQ